MFEVKLPKFPFYLVGFLFVIVASLICYSEKKAEDTVALFFVSGILSILGIVFLFLPHVWKLSVNEERIIYMWLGTKKIIKYEDINRVDISITNNIRIMVDEYEIKIDPICDGYEALLATIRNKNIMVVEEK